MKMEIKWESSALTQCTLAELNNNYPKTSYAGARLHHISGAGYRSHTDPLFASNKILKIEDLVKYKLLTLAHQAFYASRPLPPPG